jgi:hypothetical protein
VRQPETRLAVMIPSQVSSATPHDKFCPWSAPFRCRPVAGRCRDCCIGPSRRWV